MKYKQNRKLEQITESSLIVGADIAKKVHVARAQDFRGIEYGSRLTFENTVVRLFLEKGRTSEDS